MAHIIGIDLGTTNSVVAYLKGGQVEVIPNAEGNKTTPSIVMYPPGDEPVVGELAKRQLLINPERTVRSVKRLMGRRIGEIENLSRRLPYPVVEAGPDEVRLVIGGRPLSPVDVSSQILKKMQMTASDYLGEDATQAVITVPAHFNDSQRQATKKAAEEAGIEVLRIINEPTAASLAYGLNKKKVERVAVFDLGGGTFDISILELDSDVFEVRSTNGDTDLGGDNIDDAVTDWLIERIREQTGLDPSDDRAALQRVREAAEKAKCELSTLQTATISLPFIVADASGPKHFGGELKRDQLEALIRPILERLAPPCRRALTDAKLRPEEIESVVLVGGSTRIPAVQAVARELFGREPAKSVNPDEAVAIGAAIQAGVISGEIEELLLLDVTPLSLGIEVEGGVFRSLIPRNSSIPTVATRRFTTTRDNQQAVYVHVLQGERANAAENRTLAHFRLTDIPPAPAELPEIEVRFAIDADGILSVAATDMTSGVQKEIIVESYMPTQTRESERIVHEAEEKAEEDREFARRAARKQAALDTRRSVASFLDKSKDKLSEEDQALVASLMFRLDVALHADNVEAIEETEQSLLDLCNRYSDLFYVHRIEEQ